MVVGNVSVASNDAEIIVSKLSEKIILLNLKGSEPHKVIAGKENAFPLFEAMAEEKGGQEVIIELIELGNQDARILSWKAILLVRDTSTSTSNRIR